MNFCGSLYASYFKASRIIIQDDAMVVLSYRTIISMRKCTNLFKEYKEPSQTCL